MQQPGAIGAVADLLDRQVDRQVALSQHVLELDDGHQVGVAVGGRGVPLVFLHGLGQNHRAYRNLLRRVAGLGFLVVAIDAAGHGDTQDFGFGQARFADFAALTLRALDVLGIEKAVFVGHSMGGRLAIEVATAAPERVLATVLLNAAAGASFDRSLAAVAGPPLQAVRAILSMLCGTGRHLNRLSISQASQLLALRLTGAVVGNARRPVGPIRAAWAMMQSPHASSAQLRLMRDRGIPTLVLHGDCDDMVPFAFARDIAAAAGGSLHRVHGASHSWMLGNPRRGADVLRHLMNSELGDALRHAAEALGIRDWCHSAHWERALVVPNALIHELNTEPTAEAARRPRYAAHRRSVGRSDALLRQIALGDLQPAM
jgi:pimeloyl-ACP methyl ester carboxylesterase